MPTPRPLNVQPRLVLRALLPLGVSLWAVGCASTPAYELQLAAADSAVSNANTTSTQRDAGAELRVATEKLASAHQAARNKQAERALQLAQQAEVDAQLAVLTARSARSLRAAEESRDAARALREEIERAGRR